MVHIAHNLEHFATVMMSFFTQDWAKIVIPYSAAAVAITVCVAFSTFGAANGTLISGSRYGLVHYIQYYYYHKMWISRLILEFM